MIFFETERAHARYAGTNYVSDTASIDLAVAGFLRGEDD